MSDIFSATDSLKGYIYQIRYALLIALQEDINEIAIEKFDDVSIEDINDNMKMYQLKHHKEGNLTDSSPDLWKTIRIWSKKINDGDVDISESEIRYFIITTQNAKEGSIAYRLTRRGTKDLENTRIEDIVKTLDDISNKSKNKENESSYVEYNKLSMEDKKSLVQRIEVIDDEPTINEIDKKIIRELRYSCSRSQTESFFNRLESWWYKQTIEHLLTPNLEPIKKDLILDKIDDLREQFSADNLPIDFAEDINIDTKYYQEYNFVKQIKIIRTTRSSRIVNAINDFYKAYHQRATWGKENLVSVEELYRYERMLCSEWERAVDAIMDEKTEYEDAARCGRRIYNWMEIDAKIHLREKCIEPYVMRGSYHMLANDLKVGWHPDFELLLREIEEGELA